MASKTTPATPPPPPPHKNSTTPVPTSRTQALKDLKLTIEYKHLKQNAPGGVLVTPAFDDLRRWHGVIFVRKGLYQGGVFKFVIDLPKQYNDHGVYPCVRFTSSMVNPFITPQTKEPADSNEGGGGGGGLGSSSDDTIGGVLDLESAYPKWDPTTHFMVTVLTFVKKIFYLKDEDLSSYEKPADPDAKQMFLDDKDEFKRCAGELARRSQEVIYSNPHGSPISFSAPAPVHDILRKSVVESEEHAVRSSTFMLELLKRSLNNDAAAADDEEEEENRGGRASGGGESAVTGASKARDPPSSSAGSPPSSNSGVDV